MRVTGYRLDNRGQGLVSSTLRHEDVLGVEVQLHAFLTSALQGGKWSASRPGRFTSREIAAGIHWIGGWVGPRAGLDAVVNRKIPSPRRESKSMVVSLRGREKRPEREAYHLPPSSTEFKNAWSFASAIPIRLCGMVLKNRVVNLLLP
jgi:hypothetical protein